MLESTPVSSAGVRLRPLRSGPARSLFVPLLLVAAPAALAQQGEVVGLTLIDADTDQPIAGFDPLPPGATLVLDDLPTTNLNLRADTAPPMVGSVSFALDATNPYSIDDRPPYALAGDVNGDYLAWTPSVGTHVVVATAHSGPGGGGQAGTPYSLQFDVVQHGGGHGFLHVVIEAPDYVVDYDRDGSETVLFDGTGSHTHEPGHSLTSMVWTEAAMLLGTGPTISPTLGPGRHTVELTIEDDNVPPDTLSGTHEITVCPITRVVGALVEYYPGGGTPLPQLIDNLPPLPGFVTVEAGLALEEVGGQVAGSPYAGDVVVRLTGRFLVPQGLYAFSVSDPSLESRLFVDGLLHTGPQHLTASVHDIEVRLAIEDLDDLPVSVILSKAGTALRARVMEAPMRLFHDETQLPPFLNEMPQSGPELGGNAVAIEGYGFFPASAVTVHWGGASLTEPAITVFPDRIEFPAPPGTGQISVSVETPNGTSNQLPYQYTNAAPIVFSAPVTVTAPNMPTRLAWGPDERLYVATNTGLIQAVSFDDDYNVVAIQDITTLTSVSNPNLLGLAFNPWDPPDPVRVYVAHNQLFANGGECFDGFSPYSGQVSVLEGPSFDFAPGGPLITGLPVSNHDHGVNGMVFDDEGNLLVAVGGNTNAGVPACPMGDLPESPLTGAILRFPIWRLGFEGEIHYVETSGGALNDDQVFGDLVDVRSDADVSVHTAGLRNAFDILWTEHGVFASDNGPNVGFGNTSTSPTTEEPLPNNYPDELLLLVEGNYHGHPNRNRGRYDERQNVYFDPFDPSVPGFISQPIQTVPSSSNGLHEYASTTFNFALYKNVLLQKWNASLFRFELSPDGRGVETFATVPGVQAGLDVISGPAGVLIGADYSANEVRLWTPIDAGLNGMAAYDIHPRRAPASSGLHTFVIGGAGFGTPSDTTVTIGGLPAVVTSVSPTRIRGLIPVPSAPTSELLDVVVESAGQQSFLPGLFRYLLYQAEGLGAWKTTDPTPSALGEVAAGVVNGVMYLVGEHDPETFAYDVASATWEYQSLALRPFQGSHHRAEVIGGRFYLFGGLDGGSEGKVQVYTPRTPTQPDGWTLGADIPFGGGSGASAVIEGKVYYAGGIVGSSTTAQAAVYDPVLNTWSPIAPMPFGRNHAASGTDGRKLYVFGGRTGGNWPAVGFDEVQIYDPATDTWETSADPGSSIPPLPQRRGGMGNAAFYRGEFYVIGGETTDPANEGAEPQGTYTRVDVYDPLTQSWRLEAPMPTARHGIYPVVWDGLVYVAAGGPVVAHSQSDVFEIFWR